MQRRRPRQHPRRLNSGKRIVVNKNIIRKDFPYHMVGKLRVYGNKDYGLWQNSNLDNMSADEMHIAFEKAGTGVKRPTAVEVSPDRKRWRLYYKPIYPGEFWD